MTPGVRLQTIIVSVSLFIVCSGCSSIGRIPDESKRILHNLAAEYYMVAEGYLAQQNYKKAVEFYDLAMRDSSVYQQAYYKKGYASAMAGDWSVAEPIYTDLLSQDSENMTLASSLAYIVAKQGRLEEAADMYADLVSKNPYEQSLSENYIIVLIALERFDDAATVLNVFKTDFPEADRISEFEMQIENAMPTNKQTSDTPEEISAEPHEEK